MALEVMSSIANAAVEKAMSIEPMVGRLATSDLWVLLLGLLLGRFYLLGCIL